LVIKPEMPFLGAGMGFRPFYFDEIVDDPSKLDFFELLTENYLTVIEGKATVAPRRREMIERLCELKPLVLHGVSLSIAGTDPLNREYLQGLRELADFCSPQWITDHLCWTSYGETYTQELLPFPHTEENLEWVGSRVDYVQNFLKRPVGFENLSSYIRPESDMSEAEFLAELSKKTGCGILLDINNLIVSRINFDVDPIAAIRSLPSHSIWQLHAAGFQEKEWGALDTHAKPMANETWELIDWFTENVGPRSTILEWDADFPDLNVIVSQISMLRGKVSRDENHTSQPEGSP